MGSLTEILIVVGLTLLAGIFVAAEIALVSIRRSRVEQLVDERRRGAARVRHLVEDPGRFLAVIQVAITFIGFLSSAVAAVSLTSGLASLIDGVPWLAGSGEAISLVIVTSLVALFSIVVGELVPKSLALAYPDRASLLLAGPVDLPDHRGGAQAHRGARWRRRRPRGRGGADDPRGHRARRAARPRGHGSAHRHRGDRG
jgi:putative hemolysin